ncbi:MAG: DUF58 domain-containing protein [Bacteroidales bacterium]|nr:DUF58 domain-containing protein [Bacteroidales bacterium]
MQDNDILRQVRRIEIRARGLSRQLFSGEYHSAFKGRGMAFSEVREYQYGDDVRSIDWNVTARLNHPYVKIFEEERELTVMLLVDVSRSNHFGTHQQSKQQLAAEVAATLAFSAIANNDKVGVILFSDRIEKFIPPKKGSTHILHIIRELITFEPQGCGTDIGLALSHFTNVTKKRCSAFLLSDMVDGGNYTDALKIASKKHDLSVLRIEDRREQALSNIGLVAMRDAETGQTLWVDTASKQMRSAYAQEQAQRLAATEATLQRYGIDHCTLQTGHDFVRPLIKLFKMRQ